uniref:chondroitin sulfate synthase 1-like n=1 Tax=Styela clava TaxID=7725 RepID=UPI00193A0273|nr:chondroitin sulfate synthase 1-like [Styela clava]
MGKFSRNVETLVYRFIISLVVGFFAGSYLITHSDSNAANQKLRQISCISKLFPVSSPKSPYVDEDKTKKTELNVTRGVLYIGIMSTARNRNSRVVAIMNTWAKNQNIKLEIFSDNNGTIGKGSGRITTLKNGANIIQLPGVPDNSYPPQKKSFSMLKFIHDNYLEKFDWFLRADDDTYLKVDKLIKLVSRIDPNKPFVVGRAGYGKHAEDYLKPGENYCMGGTGVFLSREMLRRIGPNLSACLKEMYTKHEDVELGRCIQKITGMKCTESWETTHLFYQNYDSSGTYGSNIDKINPRKRASAATFHSNKDPKYQYKLHIDVLSDKLNQYLTKISNSEQEINSMSLLLIGRNFDIKGWNSHYGCKWDYMSRHSLYSSAWPSGGGVLTASKLTAVNNVFETLPELRNKFGLLMTAHIHEITVLHSRYIANPLTSFDMISTLKAIVSIHKKKITMYMNNIHYRRTFANLATFFKEQIPLDIQNLRFKISDKNRLIMYPISPLSERVNFIMALSGRPENLVRFLQNYKDVFLSKDERVSLTVVYFPEIFHINYNRTEGPVNMDDKTASMMDETSEFVLQNLKHAGKEFPGAEFNFIKVTGGLAFSRGAGLQIGAKRMQHDDTNDELLFFCDVDLLFSRGILNHIRRSTIRGKQVYYPTFFSQYDPNIVYANQKPPKSHFFIEEIAGFWRTFSYGMVSIYKTDFEKTGGFDLSIEGWGLEDLRFCTAVIEKAGFAVFKSNEPSMIHVYHDKNCPEELSKKQYQDCLNSRAQHYGPKSYLYNVWQGKLEHEEGEYDHNVNIISK